MLERRAWLFAVIPTIIVAVARCTDEQTQPDASPDSGTTPGAVGQGVCPDAAPSAGESCVLPEGTTCAFGVCTSAIAQCSLGTWRLGGGPPARAACPVDFPVSGDNCPPCFSEDVACVYGSNDCSVSANRSTAVCDSGAWEITTTACTIMDAGADVQRDADADSD